MAQANAVLHPYPALRPGELELEFVTESIPESATLPTRRTLDAQELEGQFTLSVKVSLKNEQQAAKRLDIPFNELSSSTRVVITGIATEARLRQELANGELVDFTKPRTLKLDSNEYRGRLDIQALLMYRNGEYQNYRCGKSEPLSIQFDPYDSPPGSDIEMHWVDFTEPSSGLTDQAEQLFCIRSDTDPPVIYLNSSINQFYGIMDSKGTHGAKARIRDSMAHRIAGQAWHVLLANTLMVLDDLVSDSPESSSSELIGQLGRWQRRLVKAFVYEDPQTEEMPNVDRLIERLSNNVDREQILIRESADFIQQFLLGNEPLEGFVKEFLLDAGS